MPGRSTFRGGLVRWSTRSTIILVVIVLTAVTFGVGVLALIRVSDANAEVARLSGKNVARLTLLGNIRGQQARINDGVAVSFAPAPPELQALGRVNMERAATRMDQLMREYGRLVAGTAGEANFVTLMTEWRAFHNSLLVEFLGRDPGPGVPLIPRERLGKTITAVIGGLDRQAALEEADAAAVADRQDAAYRQTLLQGGVATVFGALVITGLTGLAVRADAARRREQQRFQALVQASVDVIAVLDDEGHHRYLSPSVRAVMGYEPEELLGVHYRELLDPDLPVPESAVEADILAGVEREHRTETRVRHADGTFRWHELVVRNLLHDPAVQGVVINHTDITERREFLDRLAHEATHDALTGLVNRAAFLAEVDRAVTRASRDGHRTAVLFIDLNGFKQVNDSLGHEAGDRLLVGAAEALRRSVLGADTVARLGGDEFAVVLAHIDTPEHAQAVARRILTGFAEPVETTGERLRPRASIGIAVSGPDCLDPEELLRRADLAMYHVKRQRIDGWRLYTDDLRAPTAPAPTTEELHEAIHGGQLRLQYQPIVALHNGELLGVEALVRWEHPDLGPLGPLEFIALAESSGLIEPLGEWVLRTACAQVRDWRTRVWSGRRLALSVNLSPRQLDRPTLPARVLRILEETGFDAGDLILEITENAVIEDEFALTALTELHSHRIRIALDDFGTGYSSLRHLTNLPVDILKLDRCFVAELDGTTEGSAVAEAVIRLSQALNVQTIAEGIEDAAQATELTLLGCGFAQGYHFARPLDPELLETLLETAPEEWAAVFDPPAAA